MTDYNLTVEINAIVKNLPPAILEDIGSTEPDDDCDIPLTPVTPPVWLRSTDALDNLTVEEREFLSRCLPTGGDLMIGWARPVLAASAVERRVLVTAQIEVLEGIYEDPEGWCASALDLAASAGGDRAD